MDATALLCSENKFRQAPKLEVSGKEKGVVVNTIIRVEINGGVRMEKSKEKTSTGIPKLFKPKFNST